MNVLNGITEALDKKQHCISLFIDLRLLIKLRQRLAIVGFSEHAVAWFANYLSDRTQCTQFDGLMSVKLSVCNGVPVTIF